jgi:hypothetical protein
VWFTIWARPSVAIFRPWIRIRRSARRPYRFNLDYGRRYTVGDPLVEALRAHLDRETEARARAAEVRDAGAEDAEA